MAITYTETWSGFSLDIGVTERSATRKFLIHGATNETDALTATHVSTSAPLPLTLNSIHPRQTSLYLRRYSAPSFIGPGTCELTLHYERGAAGGGEEDPLDEATKYSLRAATTTEPTDVDADGLPITNSASDAFSQTINTRIQSVIITATRNEATFDPAFVETYVNRVNSDSFSWAGKTIGAGKALCTAITTPSGYTLDDSFVTVQYEFELRAPFPSGQSSFKHRILDQGKRALANFSAEGVSRLVEVLDAESKPISSDVMLNGLGTVLDKAGKRFEGYDQVDGPDWIDGPALPNADVVTSTTGAKFLLFKQYQEVPFAGLNL